MATDKTKYPYELYYKRMALQLLTLSVQMSLALFIGWCVFKFPNLWVDFTSSTLDEGIGDNTDNMVAYISLSATSGMLPLLMMITNMGMIDLIFLESDWWLGPAVGICYMIVNFVVAKIEKVDIINYLDWSALS